MAPSAFLLPLLLLLLASPAGTRRPRKRPPPENPIDKIRAQENFDAAQFAGKWFLVSVAARCAHLSENSDNLEATNIVVSVPSTRALPAGLLVDTFRPLDGHCWNIKQMYFPTKTPGRFQLKGRRKLVDVVVQTDYSSYAILYYQKDRKISAKLYGRAVRVSDAVMATFEQRVAAVGMNEDSIFYFPVYGFCDSADQFHLLDDTKYTGRM
ncbi:Complement component C8 gamma chain [Varanus komodoensis]|uniref:complement component C8 gamma chain isoform X2 n=1 Tax=Varanus komodoensis TaxID=61221 RepID=UPI001CF7B79B|nr:complement component C8 gamma chain isoform X2 [Varanus komodoensis]KAF7240996.1 Complement component C8 gamma chain [Varanus komodoensis]